jgi:hypothetical protein
MATKKEKTPVEEITTVEEKTTETKETGTKAEDQPRNKKKDARDALDSGEGTELTAIAVKSLTNLEEKVEAIDWKLWEIYNIVKNYVESAPISAPQVSQPQASAADIASEIAKTLGEEPEPKKSVVGKLFGK